MNNYNTSFFCIDLCICFIHPYVCVCGGGGGVADRWTRFVSLQLYASRLYLHVHDIFLPLQSIYTLIQKNCIKFEQTNE